MTPSTVTWRSAIASSSADCVFGVARLISSTRTTLAKIGPGRNSKFRVRWSKTERPGHVGRLEIWRALDPLRDRALDASGDRSREHGLGRPGHVLEEHVAVARERGQDELDLVALAVDDRLDVVDEPIGDGAGALEALRLRRSATIGSTGAMVSTGVSCAGIVIDARVLLRIVRQLVSGGETFLARFG